ncbi:MAG: PDDEXK nuclease domain-containing protein [Candidatus Loosdrechtia sp.]|uniref:PDDEXK nuclease domain-containing protein n=1 Tax=Candidatus Loosdrechtia sp. TaxID=3101272 RepID=UPI003A6ED5C1|nr:MAG: PDDEXK nuclease domain-containing protein [Candidatus Jettenia sp. AMX2]
MSSKNNLTFKALVKAICLVHTQMTQQAAKAVNVSLTMRNWFIGMYITEFELHGAGRAGYGENLFKVLAEKLADHNVSGCRFRQLYNYRNFYQAYPQILRTVSAKFKNLTIPIKQSQHKLWTASAKFTTDPEKLLSSLSYSHLELLVKIDDSFKRFFYECECIRGNWSVRELERQIASLYYERSGLSRDKKKLSTLSSKSSEINTPELTVRDPYIFEFIGLKSREVMGESHLEDALLDRLQEFMLELGHGFCFEARQKRILLDDEHNFVDLVFYHRILKCHILIELKVDQFKYEHIGQLNTYVSWYKKHAMTEGDNPPIGILLCTGKNHAKVEYALAGMDNKLFVTKYQLELPKKEAIRKFLEQELRGKE